MSEATLRQVLDDPDSLEARLAHAAALTAEGDPRGELIDVQCALEASSPSDPAWAARLVREQALFAEHQTAWLAPFASMTPFVRWKRGMIEDAYVKAAPLAFAPGALFDREPITSLSMREVTRGTAKQLGQHRGLDRLRTLRVAESKLGKEIGELVTARMSRLRSLDLYQAGVDDDGLAALESVLPQLEALVLSGNRIDAEALSRLMRSAELAPRLASLSLAWLLPSGAGASVLAESLALPSLVGLDLACNRLTADDLADMATNACFRRLRRLRLEQNALEGVPTVAVLEQLPALEDLDLSTNPIGPAGAAALAATKLPLERLDLMQARIGNEGMRSLAAARFPLEALDARYCNLDADGAKALAQAEWPLTELDLWANPIGDEGLAALARAPFTKTLRTLTLGFTKIGDAGITALAAGDFPVLERIVLRGDPITAAGGKALSASTTLPALRSVRLEGTKTPKGSLKGLAKRGVRLES